MTLDAGALAPRFCFASRRALSPPPPPPGVRMALDHAEALAELVPLLGCGEEAASLAFDGLADGAADPAAAAALGRIADEELVHDGWMKALAAALPPPRLAAGRLSAARRFHVRLGRGGAALHLARIAAVDAATVTVLARLLRPGAPIAADPAAAAIFARIRHEEAAHVATSRMLALRDPCRAAQRDAAVAARAALADVLHLAADDFEALGVDPDALDQMVRHLPPGLLPT